MGSAAGARHRLGIGLREAPGTVRRETVDAHPLMIPVTVAQVAVVRMKLSDEQVLPTAAHGAIRGGHERQIARDRIGRRDLALGRGSTGVLPAMTGRAAVRMLDACVHGQIPARRRPSRTASSVGPSFSAR